MTYFELNEITHSGAISAAAVNISNRQRMLLAGTALLSARLVCSSDSAEREKLRSELLEAIELMERSHSGLIGGDASMNLPEKLSPALRAMYFEPPVYLDRQVRSYIAEVKALAREPEEDLTPDCPHLRCIIGAGGAQLLESLDAVVSQYQKQQEAEQLALALELAELRERAAGAEIAAQTKAGELEQALCQLQETEMRLALAEKMAGVGQIVANGASDLNNPINFVCATLIQAHKYALDLIDLLRLYQKHYPNPPGEIQSRTQVIEFELLVKQLPKMLSAMKKGAGRIREIVFTWRNLFRLSEAPIQPVDIHSGIESALLMLQNRLKGKSGRPEIHVIKEFGALPLVECCGDELNQVFMNILSNAIEALEKGNRAPRTGSGKGKQSPARLAQSPTIWIRTEMLRPDCVTVRIADNGPGMTEEVKEQLFDLSLATKTVGEGSGLGLVTGYQTVVQKYRGAIWCVSEPGGGAEFWIELPVRHLDSAGAESAGAESAGAESAGAESAGAESAGAESAGADFGQFGFRPNPPHR
ncbi:ATP-binding protein [Kamptonema formosum]|uniref:ATP-binding protein n=1 Tax=Kamptonema formosum TaxID=331992 RepID=UPI00034CF21F|nr:ATP-binding protein [Oscillatoria sp. PCC 10802]